MRIAAPFMAMLVLLASAGPATRPATLPSGGEVLFRDDFSGGLAAWSAELEKPGTVATAGGRLEINVPGGATLWLRQKLAGPVLIEYSARVVKAGGPNDRVSDLNCFWMATDARSPGDLFGAPRSGRFTDYDQLKCYYVGLGGNSNTTTRFRRYIGERDNRPLLPEHDLKDAAKLLEPNRTYHIRLLADGSRIQYWRDGECLFDFTDPAPYTSGHFGFRTVTSHIVVSDFSVSRATTRPAP